MKRGKELFFIVVLLFFIGKVSATNVGVSPGKISFENVLRGGYAERPVIVTIDSEREVRVTANPRGEIADWIGLSEENFTVSKGNPYQFMASVTPPIDTPNGNYSGFVRVKSSHLGESTEGRATGLIIPTLEILVEVEVTDIEVIACRVLNVEVESAEKGDDIVFKIEMINNGNIRFAPNINFDVWNQEATAIVKNFKSNKDEVTPTQKGKIIVRMPSDDLEIGQYWVDIEIPECSTKRTLTFDVLEEGALRARGVLEKIDVITWSNVDETIPITATFRNTGEKSLEAIFKGKAMQGNKIVQIFESDEKVFVPLDEKSDFQFYFTPKLPGRYIISGRIFYDGKRTYEKSAILNIRDKKNFLKSALKVLVYLILIIIILYLLYKIRNERRSYNRLRRYRR